MVELETVDGAALQRLVQVVLEYARPELILLFGSRAWGTPRDDSHYDLMLVVDAPDMVERWNG